MTCQKCHRRLIIQRNLSCLFDQPQDMICEFCYQKHLNLYPYFVLPIGQGLAHIFELTIDMENISTADFMYVKPYLKAFNKNPNIPILYFDILDKNIINQLEHLNLGHLIILTLTYKEVIS